MRTRLLAPMPNRPCLIIAAIAASAYVRLAVEAGFKVICMDAFADEDTQHLTADWHQISCSHQQLNAVELLTILDSIDLTGCIGFCYGAGFEQQPALLTQVAKRLPLLGNEAQSVRDIKCPRHFFWVCEALSFPHPAMAMTPPADLENWLLKEIGASGGVHIQHAAPMAEDEQGKWYYQAIKKGTSISCLFLAHTNGVEVIGFNEQWVSPATDAPFRFGGLVSHADISNVNKIAITTYVHKLSQTYRLVGLNSCDVICNGEDVWVLEINPRLSASVAMYAMQRGHLMHAHVAACIQPNMPANGDNWQVSSRSRACQVLYSLSDIQVPEYMDWPEWITDIPKAGQLLHQGMPILTVNAQADNATEARVILAKRVQIMNEKLTHW
jgi:uncharacterized protein